MLKPKPSSKRSSRRVISTRRQRRTRSHAMKCPRTKNYRPWRRPKGGSLLHRHRAWLRVVRHSRALRHRGQPSAPARSVLMGRRRLRRRDHLWMPSPRRRSGATIRARDDVRACACTSGTSGSRSLLRARGDHAPDSRKHDDARQFIKTRQFWPAAGGPLRHLRRRRRPSRAPSRFRLLSCALYRYHLYLVPPAQPAP